MKKTETRLRAKRRAAGRGSIDNSTSSGSPETSETYVSLPVVVGNGTIPLKGNEENF